MIVYNKIGFHTAGSGGNPSGIGDYVRALDAAGIPAVVCCADGTVGLSDIISCWQRGSTVEHVAVWRHVPASVPDYSLSPNDAAARTVEQILAAFPAELTDWYDRVWIAFGNELNKDSDDVVSWIGFWSLAVCERLNAVGMRAVGPNWAAGTPEPHHWTTLGQIAFLEYAAVNRDRVAVGLHEYSYNVNDIWHNGFYLVGRFEQLLNACDDMGIGRPTVFVKEFGWEERQIPPLEEAMADIRNLAGYYGASPEILGAALWYLGPNYGDIHNQTQRLIRPVTDFTLDWSMEIPDPPPPEPPPARHRAIVLKAPQEVTPEQWETICSYAYDFRHTVTASHDDTLTILSGGREDSYAKIVYPDLPSQAETIGLVEASGYAWIDVTGDVFPEAQPFGVRYWPCEKQYPVTQGWGARPEYYAQFGWTGGHEGIDFGVPLGRPFFAVDDGTIVWAGQYRRGAPDRLSAYGWHVVVEHAGGYETLYAHCAPNPPIEMGDDVQGGQVIAYSGNTGNSTGPHLHFSILQDGARTPGFPAEYIDPTPWLFDDPPDPPAPPPPPPPPVGEKLDLAGYMFPPGATQYIVRAANGSQEKYRNWADGNRRYIQKNRWPEIYEVGASFIALAADFTPNDTDFYVRTAGNVTQYYAPYVPRFMAVGEQWADGGHRVQFYKKSDCSPSDLYSGSVTQYARLLAKHNTFTTPHGRVCGETIVLETSIKADFSESETHWFARGLGRVGWLSGWGEAWATAENVSDQQPEPLELPACWKG